MARVLVKHVDKTYANGVTAVRDLSLDVADGELFVLVGPSGSGKSTALRLIAGLEQATHGDISIGDRLVNCVAPADRDVAMVFQNAALYPHMTARQNMAFGLSVRRLASREVERRVGEAAEALSIGPLLDRRPAELSGGERGRVAIGRAIVREPKVLLLDEPLSDLDPPLRGQLRLEFARLRTRFAMTMIYVTHDQAEAMTLGDRIGVMERGAMQQIGAPLDVYGRPASAFVAAFIGSPGMNLFRGQVRGGYFHLAMPPENGAAAAEAIEVGQAIDDGDATLGVRPSDLTTEQGNENQPLATVTIDLIERLGHETLVHFGLAGGRHVARLPDAADVRLRDPLRLSIRPGARHFFSAADGRRLN